MADPTSIVTKFSSYDVDKQRHAFAIKNNEPLVHWALASFNRAIGRVEFADDEKDLISAGIVVGEKNGAESLTGTESGTVGAVVRGGIILKNVSVTGASAVTDISKFAYATDGQTLTLNRPTIGVPCGIITNWYSGTYCDVYLFDLIESILVSALCAPTQYKSFGTFPTNALQGNSAVTLHTETAKEHYRFLSLHAIPKAHDNAVVGGSQTISIEIGSTPTSGGILTLTYTSFDAANDMGVVIDATQISNNNEVHIGDTVVLKMAAGGTGFTPDAAAAVEIYALIERLPGA